MNIFSIETDRFSPDVVHEVVDSLTNSEVSCLPFDTCYGFCCDSASDIACVKLSELKHRDASKEYAVLVSDVTMLENYIELSKKAREFVLRYMPGRVTLVAPLKEGVSLPCSSNGLLGVRIVQDGFLTSVVQIFGKPIATTSANISGKELCFSTRDVFQQFPPASDLDLLVDGGALDSTASSTVVKIVGDEVEILRQGDVVIDM